MSLVPTYPAEVTSYSIFFSEDKVQIQLSGIGQSLAGGVSSDEMETKIANIDFIPIDAGKATNSRAFINRGGFLQITRPLYLLPSILTTLEQSGAILVDKKGNLSMNSKVNSTVK